MQRRASKVIGCFADQHARAIGLVGAFAANCKASSVRRRDNTRPPLADAIIGG
jgi:hypothetical protein